MNWTVLYALLSKKISEMEGVHNEVVEELPSTGQENVCYFVPKDEPGTNDIYDEYIWTDSDGYEKIGSTQIDLTGYLKSEDVAAVALSGDYDDLDDKPDLSGYLTSSDVANVAISGAYSDLSGAPTLASVATSGDYNDLENKPSIPDSVSISETLTPDIYKKKIAKLTIGSSDTEVYSDDAEKIVKKIFGEDTILEGNPISFDAFTGIETAKSCSVGLLPIQDLHGYDSPWVGGAGKNKIVLKDYTASGNGVTITSIKDDDGNVIGFDLDGTATAGQDFYINATAINLPSQTWYATVGTDTYVGVQLVLTPSYTGIKPSGTYNGSVTSCYVGVANGTVCNHLKIYPMICDNAITDKSFAPYSNICPISGRTEVSVTRTGKNLANPTNISVFNSNKYFSTTNYSTTPMIPVKASTHYVLSCRKGVPSAVGGQDVRIYFWDSNGALISYVTNGSFDTPSNCVGISFYVGYSDGDFTDGENVKAQVEEGSTATTYEPYQGETYTETLGQTVYGGKVDFVSGKLTIDTGYITFNGTENWGSGGGTYKFFGSPTFPNPKYTIPNETQALEYFCNTDAIHSSGWIDSGNYGLAYAYGFRVRLANQNPDTMTVDQFKTWLASNQITVCYPLATPTEITLTAEQISLLKGNNVISADGNNIKIAISADIKAAIDKAIQESITDVLEEEY